MKNQDNITSIFQKSFSISLSVIAIALVIVICIPNLRSDIRSFFITPERIVLSVATGNLMNDGTPVKVVKYKTLDGILVEILGSDESGSRALIDKIQISGEHDGFFDFYGQASQLAILDVDNDGKMELVAPTFDKQLVAHLNIYKFNNVSGKFEPLQPPSK